jgi:hypothetical protein
MAIQLRLALGAACVIAPLLSPEAASAQDKRRWVDPPAAIGATGGAAPAGTDTRTAPAAVPDETAAKPAVRASAARHAAPAAAPQRAVSSRPAKAGASVRPRGSSVHAATRSLPGVAKSSRRGEPSKTRVTSRTAPVRAARDRRLSVANQPLELMNLQTIELQDGRRLDVLTRPDPRTIEDYLSRR